jgi:large subunit ribosomal protein L24
MRRLKAGDQVIVIRGDDKSKRGKVSRVIPERNLVVIEGINVVTRHIRATPQRPGGVLEVEAPLHASKVMLVDPETNKRTRVKVRVVEGDKQRIAKSEAIIVGTTQE